MCAQPTLFGADGPAPKRIRKANESHPLRPWFEAIEALVGVLAVKAAGGRVARIARQIADAGVTPEELRRLPLVVAACAPYMTCLDLAAVQRCWPWLREPPRQVRPSPADWRQMSLNPDGSPPV